MTTPIASGPTADAPTASGAGTGDATPATGPRRWLRGLAGPHVAFAVLVCATMVPVWALDGLGWFWPIWVWFAFGCTVGAHLLALHVVERWDDPDGRWHAFYVVLAAVAVVQVVVWALAGMGEFWPVWSLMTCAFLAGTGWIWNHRDALPWSDAQALQGRVDELTRTRRGALDVQAAELRRIERDLHDGAQARLVALSMQLGRAEQRLEDAPEGGDPALLELVRAARGDATAAIAELRDLARGIAPPVLADRGLIAAVEALAQRHALPVRVDARVGERPLPVVESAAYFVVAEALTNVVKHARATGALVELRGDAEWLTVTVADDGRGGADPDGSGLQGLRRRAEALDGTLTVEDGGAAVVGGGGPDGGGQAPAGPGTIVKAVLPCGS
ncbi:MAG: histidine kinase [Solirubrobacteraceae bacterium]|nr:histidine kinase [Solirubrobacteraceae bacterium]